MPYKAGSGFWKQGGKGVKGRRSLRQCLSRSAYILWPSTRPDSAVLGTCARQHSVTPRLTTQLMLEAGNMCMYKKPWW